MADKPAYPPSLACARERAMADRPAYPPPAYASYDAARLPAFARLRARASYGGQARYPLTRRPCRIHPRSR